MFVPPDRPCDVRILTLRNAGHRPKRLRVVPFFDLALEESPNESVGKIRDETVGTILVFQNRNNDFERGFAFAATSLAEPVTETIRTRFFGGPGRDIHTPAFVETGAPDGAARDDGRRVAAFADEISLPPGGEAKFVVVFGQARSRAEALAAAGRVSVAEAEADLAATRASWAARLDKVEVRTNRPDFDRLVNTWLPYQLYASRLWGRVGPNQRGGATGFRDQLQDVLPLTLIEPRLTRAQLVLHASQQFLEGDVLKWWHRAPNGGTGLGQRTKASDPHLWLPYILARYVRETGDASVLDEVTPFLEARARAGQPGDLGRHPARLARDRHRLRARPARHRLHPRTYRRERSPAAQGRRLERRHRHARPAGDRHQRMDGLLLANVLAALRQSRARRATRPSRRSARRRSRASARPSTSGGGATITCSTLPTTGRSWISRTP